MVNRQPTTMPSIVQQPRQSPVVQQQQAPVALRAPGDEEHYAMVRFAAHTTRCAQCSQPLEAVRRGITLCPRGALHAQLVTQYLFSRNGKVFSLIDHDMRRYVQVHVPQDCAVIRELMLAIERGLSTDSDSSADFYLSVPSEKQKEKESQLQVAAPKQPQPQQAEVLLTMMNKTELRRYSDSSNGKGSGGSPQLVLARPRRKKQTRNAHSSSPRASLTPSDMASVSSEAVSQTSDDDLFIFPETPTT